MLLWARKWQVIEVCWLSECRLAFLVLGQLLILHLLLLSLLGLQGCCRRRRSQRVQALVLHRRLAWPVPRQSSVIGRAPELHPPVVVVNIVRPGVVAQPPDLIALPAVSVQW